MKVGYDKVGGQLNINSGKAAGVKTNEAKASKDAGVTDGKASASTMSAKVNFSEQAQRINKIKELATPDMDSVREDKVAHFQKMIDEGSYSVDPADIADRMVDAHLTL